MFQLLTSPIAKIILFALAIKIIANIKKEKRSLKEKNQFLEREIEWYRDKVQYLQEEIYDLEYNIEELKSENERLKYETDIKTGEIEFFDTIKDEYYIDGLNIKVDFNVSTYNDSEKEILTTDVVQNLLNIIYSHISFKLKVILKKEGVSFYFRDVESIQLEEGINTIGYYSSSNKQIHVALSDDVQCIKTLYHEIGHFIDDVLSDKYDKYFSDYDEDTNELFESDVFGLRDYATTNKQEFIAVAFEEYLYDEDSLNHIPLTRDLMKKYIKSLEDKYAYLFSDNTESMEYYDWNCNICSEEDEYDYLSEFVEV